MSHVYVTSDWHFGHTGIIGFRTQFPSEPLHSEHILETAREILTKRDVLFCLGDMAFTQGGLDMIESLNCRKILVRGNHDTLPTSAYSKVFAEIYGAYAYKSSILTHIPIHPTELYRWNNIHGHCHRGGPDGTEYYNAILEFNEYKPIKYQDILAKLAMRKEREDALL